LRCERIVAARYRGNSAQQMKTFGRHPARESVVYFQKAGWKGSRSLSTGKCIP
jgi:hypothetical protein